jgi:hypothetical protein
MQEKSGQRVATTFRGKHTQDDNVKAGGQLLSRRRRPSAESAAGISPRMPAHIQWQLLANGEQEADGVEPV